MQRRHHAHLSVMSAPTAGLICKLHEWVSVRQPDETDWSACTVTDTFTNRRECIEMQFRFKSLNYQSMHSLLQAKNLVPNVQHLRKIWRSANNF